MNGAGIYTRCAFVTGKPRVARAEQAIGQDGNRDRVAPQEPAALINGELARKPRRKQRRKSYGA
jgi:hypothetical protein